MKKLVLLVSVFLLMTGMVFADVTFAPAVTGEASVTWGLDLQPDGKDYEKVNSGFDADNSSTFDLGITIDPFDAKTGEEGMYGEIELTGMGVTAKSGSDVAVTAPTVTAKLYFMDGLYMRVCTNPEPEYDLVSPLGELITVDDDWAGSWYDEDGTNDTGTTVEADYGNAGYGFTYDMDALTVNADFVSNDEWGSEDDTTEFALEDYDDNEDGFLTLAEYNQLKSDVSDADLLSENSYVVVAVETVEAPVEYQVFTNDDGDILLRETEPDLDVNDVYAVALDEGTIESSLYTLGMDVTYELDGIGTFMAYVLPGHADQWNTFSWWGYGGSVEITAVDDYVTPKFSVDLKYDETKGFIGGEKLDILEWEACLELPASYELSEDMSFDASAKFLATDNAMDVNEPKKERTTYDAYFTAGADVMGADLNAALLYQELFYYKNQTATLTLDASYEVEMDMGTVTPSLGWDCEYGNTHIAGDEYGVFTAAVAAEVVDNTTFTLQYKTGDILEKPDDADFHDPGVVTFETKIAY